MLFYKLYTTDFRTVYIYNHLAKCCFVSILNEIIAFFILEWINSNSCGYELMLIYILHCFSFLTTFYNEVVDEPIGSILASMKSVKENFLCSIILNLSHFHFQIQNAEFPDKIKFRFPIFTVVCYMHAWIRRRNIFSF
jgi:hypothetical protein